MIKVINRVKKGENTDLSYWLTQSHQKRLECVEILRTQYYEDTPRLQRTFKIIQLKES